MAMKFSLEKAVKDATPKKDTTKRAAKEEPRKSKFMKVSEIVVEDGPKPEKQSPKKLTPGAPVVVCLYKVTDHAGDVWETYKQSEPKPLWQIQICHEVPRPITYQFRDRFADFVKTCKDTPDTLQDLLKKYYIT
jgi:hypothetical protein